MDGVIQNETIAKHETTSTQNTMGKKVRIRNGHPVISHRGACSLDYLTDLNSQIFPFQANEFVLIIYGYDRLVNVPIRINKIQNY
ncbi:hypothetical protein DERP_011073 [Dermatophagoides pteronyssinus]|uniref:Uncharacterized protein n=1 Tax=Dermatophagoides pteronyssinus TaxID=6956 RepID=A0ABQ8J8T0_DERPT|nr:hypothetical protein DERP_011073 [Dermatophagoides pteronyssinus]